MDNNGHAQTIAGAAGVLYQLHDDGAIWRSDGKPCNGQSCPGWARLDNNPRTGTILSAED
ncbi:hypothetical protein CBM2633_P200002 [Cupriavidus taiwanensis]|uniref:Uncharacterized protein n=2 Tax=Cupriavidus TaxID=106589 RepID=A0A375DBF1_9BURK|nr:hypothetical protein CBM2588_P220002 [Cupriavidus taiwanensis]SOZ40472.1 hypothetical protein CBM2605_P200002 [Cupriavidus neocaledonicus]SOY74873.1 hypothetical protein CBM2592_P230002 [Cupriavidus taiwanensis]SOY74879.1 hypothetical protein CBM2585_P200003 [Cupriavidus taiwanensis]SOY75566.1 hypothetical protein CBM2589_P200002 [Cupriavidus taiwanensis]